MHPTWQDQLRNILESDAFFALQNRVAEAENKGNVFPPRDLRFAALSEDPSTIRVVILGQDPYILPGQAHGYSFSVPEGVAPPPSLINIFKEIDNEGLGPCNRRNGNLLPWVRQGVLLLNTHLSVQENEPGSHQSFGWESFTDEVLKCLQAIRKDQPLVFLLWGAHARKKKFILKNNPLHLILETSHPSPLGAYRGFIGSNCFSNCNQWLINNGDTPIDWRIH